MSSQDAKQIQFNFLSDLPVVVQRHEGQLTSDAGLLPIAQFDRRLNYTARMAECLEVEPTADPGQQPRKPQIQHPGLEMLRQRLFGILAGYEDCNDHDTLRDDPAFKMIADRLPEDEPLASQPTLSRFENSVTPAALQKLIDFTITTGIERLREKHGGKLPASITLDSGSSGTVIPRMAISSLRSSISGSSGTVVPVFAADHQRADDQACVPRLAKTRNGACLGGSRR